LGTDISPNALDNNTTIFSLSLQDTVVGCIAIFVAQQQQDWFLFLIIENRQVKEEKGK
jgi:hypothetical protein